MPKRSALRYLHAVLLSWLSIAGAGEIDVGGQIIEIPTPAGFTDLLPVHSPYYESSMAYVASSNIRYISLIPTDAAAILERGDHTEYARYMNIETERSISTQKISTRNFDELRELMLSQLDELIEGAKEELPGFLDEGNARASEEFNAEVDISVGDLVPLPVHYDSANAIAYTMYMRVAGEVDGAGEAPEVVNVTILALLVRERVLFLYVYGTEDDVEWTRSTAASWADAILAANADGSGAGDAQEPVDSGGSRWSGIFREAAVVAIVVLVMIWLIKQVAVKHKRRE